MCTALAIGITCLAITVALLAVRWSGIPWPTLKVRPTTGMIGLVLLALIAGTRILDATLAECFSGLSRARVVATTRTTPDVRTTAPATRTSARTATAPVILSTTQPSLFDQIGTAVNNVLAFAIVVVTLMVVYKLVNRN
jgi:hypothetical protein